MALLPITISNYDGFRTDALDRASQGLGYDVDGYYGYQCWDLAAELWMHLDEFDDGTLYPQTGPNYYASECWTESRYINAGNTFTLIENITDLKRGDVIVLGPSAISQTGHIAFCDENYRGSTMNLLGQNQVDPSLIYGHIPTVTALDISAFLGAFRLPAWNPAPTPSSTDSTRARLPLILTTLRLLHKV